MAARAYRELLKVQRNVFAGDHQARIAARVETRSQFVLRADAEPSEVPALIEEAYNTAGFLHENVAQTVLNDKGNYGAAPAAPTSRAPAFWQPTRAHTHADG